jgi:Helix-turn-helix domain
MSWEHVDAAFRFNASEYGISNTLALGCKLFLLTLANYLNKDTLICNPSLETLSRDMGIGIKQTREYKKELISRKVISCNFIKGYKSPNYRLHIKTKKQITTPPPQDTHLQKDETEKTNSGELMTYPTNPIFTPPQDTQTIIKPLSNPIYEKLKRENLEKYIYEVSRYAQSIGIDTKNKAINVVEDLIRYEENPRPQALTNAQKNANIQAIKEMLANGKGIKITKY